MKTELSTCLLRWSFERHRQRITCQVSAAPAAMGYEVMTVPHWDINATAIETFDAPGSALCRHATIVAQRREAGWNLDTYTS